MDNSNQTTDNASVPDVILSRVTFVQVGALAAALMIVVPSAVVMGVLGHVMPSMLMALASLICGGAIGWLVHPILEEVRTNA